MDEWLCQEHKHSIGLKYFLEAEPIWLKLDTALNDKYVRGTLTSQTEWGNMYHPIKDLTV